MNTPGKASLPVIKRLPKYYRYLRTLKNDGIGGGIFMPQIVSNLPWLVIWVVVFLVQSYFFRKKNSFGSLILLWLTLLVGIFWDQALRALVPGIPEMWLFGTQIWILFLIVAVRHYLNYRKGGRGRDASGDKAPEHPMEPSEEGETSGSSTKTEE